MKRNRSFTDEQFTVAVANCHSIADSLRSVGLSPCGANYTTAHQLVKSLGLDTSHFTGQGWNRGVLFKHPTGSIPLELILRNGFHYSSNNLRKRLISEGLKSHECEWCHYTEWLGFPIPLELDHIDGNHDNNELSNLRILCPTCHALTPTHGGRNTHSAKYNRLRNLPIKSLATPVNRCKCEKQIGRASKACKSCFLRPEKIVWPTSEEIRRMIVESSVIGTARKLGVSDNAVRKRLKTH